MQNALISQPATDAHGQALAGDRGSVRSYALEREFYIRSNGATIPNGVSLLKSLN